MEPPAGPGGNPASTGACLRYQLFGRVSPWKPSGDSAAPRPVSLTPVQVNAGSR